MITDRDIVMKVIAAGKDPTQRLVREAATMDVVAVGADDTIEQAIRLMSENQVGRLPVIEGEQCVGVISQAEIARALPPEDTGRLVRSISAG